MIDENIAHRIRNLDNWEEIRQFEMNARDSGRLSNEIVNALKARTAELGRSLVAEKTGLRLGDLSPAQEKIVQAVSEYVGIMKQKGKYPGRTFEQLHNRGLIGAAETAVCKEKPTQGFAILAEADLENLSYEQIVIDHPEEFSARALWYARRTLGLPNASSYPPAEKNSDIQTRTAALTNWLKIEAANNDGIIPPFTNAEAAAAMGIEDRQRYGRVHGNIQSRIDFACYLCDLPPLSLTAVEPFAGSWANEEKEWDCPVSDMQKTVQSYIWRHEDFDQILSTTEELTGKSDLLWKEAHAKHPQKVQRWIATFAGQGGAPYPSCDSEHTTKRNPIWTRDELILALDVYLQHRAALPGKDSQKIAELSTFLNKMGEALGQSKSATYRNTNGVYMKMMNFRRLDPLYVSEGKVGLARGNKDEKFVWDEFSGNSVRLANIVTAIRATVEEHSADSELAGLDEPGIQEAEEGRVLTRLHRFRERSRALVEECKKLAYKKHGRLFCAACGFDFSKKYGPLGDGLIDVHHTKPVHTLAEGSKTKIEDLVLLCANCHRVVHSSRRWLTVEQVKALIRE